MTENGARARVLGLSTAAFTLLFAVWLMLGMLSVKAGPELDLSPGRVYNLTLAAILSGSVLRFHFGVWADRYGGRRVLTALLLFTAVPTFCVSRVTGYYELLACALLYGVAGNAFSVGVAWNAAWFPRDRQGLALGVFGAGNVGASVTKLLGPLAIAAVPTAGLFGGLLPGGWRLVPVCYSVLLVLAAAAVWRLAPKEDRTPARGRSLAEVAAPLRRAKVWEFGLHYTVVFGAYVALSGVLPQFYFAEHGRALATELGLHPQLVADFDRLQSLRGAEHAAYLADRPEVAGALDTLTASVGVLVAVGFVFPASLLRPLGGHLSDKYGGSAVMGAVFAGMLAAGVALALPGDRGVWWQGGWLLALGVGMGIGKAAVYKLIPDHFPDQVGPVGGLVGLLGALGGVLLPIAWTALPGNPFVPLLGLTAAAAAWYAAGALTAPAPSLALPYEPEA